jgi:hypothetical protein
MRLLGLLLVASLARFSTYLYEGDYESEQDLAVVFWLRQNPYHKNSCWIDVLAMMEDFEYQQGKYGAIACFSSQ